MRQVQERIDEWYCRSLRMVIWKQWKRNRTRYRHLFKLDVNRQKAWAYANTRKGNWQTAHSPILKVSVIRHLLILAGYIFFQDYYMLVRFI